MWGGYGTDPYDLLAMKESGASFDDRQKKGIWLEINDFSLTPKIKKSSITNSTPDPEEYYNLLEVQPGSQTGSLTNLLGFTSKENDVVKMPIGKFANKKEISEAIILIPYLDKGIKFPMQGGKKYTDFHSLGTLNHDETSYYKTREIIPGKHFLPINEELFVNILNFHIIEATKRHFVDSLHGAGGMDNEEVALHDAIRFEALNTDVGKMISTLSSLTKHGGFQLPPEFDFMHNASVPPFQMLVIPFEHTLHKQELIDIYQGIMPDSSLGSEKVSNEIVVNPYSPPSELPYGKYYIPFINDAMFETSVASFLTPEVFLHEQVSDFCKLSECVIPNEYNSSAGFYRNLKFMVFKVKQRSKKDYSNYRQRQIASAILSTLEPQDKVDSSFQELEEGSALDKLMKDKTIGDVFGANWPYDYFSLLETIRLDISISIDDESGI
jgi:hypothetical protein